MRSFSWVIAEGELRLLDPHATPVPVLPCDWGLGRFIPTYIGKAIVFVRSEKARQDTPAAAETLV